MYTAQTSRFNEQVALHVLLEAKADPNKNVILAGYMSIHTIAPLITLSHVLEIGSVSVVVP